MKKRCLLFLLVIALLLSACATAAEEEKTPSEEPQGQIYLYGENHADDDCLQKELEIWGEYYETGMRDLFIEYSYSNAGFLNEWMQADSDEILMQLYQDSEGTAAHSQNVLDFYRTIKEKYPETVFHGTDVCHQYDSTGERYLALLRERGLEDSDEYALAIENIEQGKTFSSFYGYDGEGYRENCMAENFIRAFEANGGKSVMGIYGGAHVDPESLNYYGMGPSMAMLLAERYGDALHWRDLNRLELVRTETMTVNGKDYEADYYGVCEDWWPGRSPAFWQLKDAYEDFKDCPFMGEESVDYDFLVSYNMPIRIRDQQVYVIELTSSDGEVERLFYLSNGYTYPDPPVPVIKCIDVE